MDPKHLDKQVLWVYELPFELWMKLEWKFDENSWLTRFWKPIIKVLIGRCSVTTLASNFGHQNVKTSITFSPWEWKSLDDVIITWLIESTWIKSYIFIVVSNCIIQISLFSFYNEISPKFIIPVALYNQAALQGKICPYPIVGYHLRSLNLKIDL